MLLSVTKAAERLGVSTKTLRRYVAQKRLTIVRYTPRGKIYIDTDELERFRTGCTRPAKERAPPTSRRGSARSQFLPRSEWGRSA
jgi:excisionase family DNA binding protein